MKKGPEQNNPWIKSYNKDTDGRPSWSQHGLPDLFHAFVDFRERGKDGVHLDIGSGDGNKTVEFSEGGYKTVGLDLSKEGILKSSRIHQVGHFLVGDALFLPFQSEMIDSASDIMMATHLKPEQWCSYMKELTRVLKHGSLALFVLFSKEDEHFHGHPVTDEYDFDFSRIDPNLEPNYVNFRHYQGMHNKHFDSVDVDERFHGNFCVINKELGKHPVYPHRKLWNVIVQKD